MEIFLEKGILALIVGCALLLAADQIQDNQKRSDVRVSVSKVVTEGLIDQRKSLMKAMDEFVLLADEIVREGGLRDDEKQSDRLSNLERKMMMSVNFISAVGESEIVADHATDLRNNITRLSLTLRGSPADAGISKSTRVDMIEKLESELLISYVAFCRDISEVTQRAVSTELDKK